MDFNKKINENKKKHMFGVAQFMYEQVPKYNLNPEEMYILGLFHDIGYIYDGWKKTRRKRK